LPAFKGSWGEKESEEEGERKKKTPILQMSILNARAEIPARAIEKNQKAAKSSKKNAGWRCNRQIGCMKVIESHGASSH